mmetsp:Transcript_44299/g.115125  ORF Transcript_44299/g.115125 Transcript_44299/m.115125 type:complete len:83 (-) Transcript_44299:615-863(-)
MSSGDMLSKLSTLRGFLSTAAAVWAGAAAGGAAAGAVERYRKELQWDEHPGVAFVGGKPLAYFGPYAAEKPNRDEDEENEEE